MNKHRIKQGNRTRVPSTPVPRHAETTLPFKITKWIMDLKATNIDLSWLSGFRKGEEQYRNDKGKD